MCLFLDIFTESIFYWVPSMPTIYMNLPFFSKLLADISFFSTSYVLIGGNFNCTPNPAVDQSPRPNPSRKSLKLAEFCANLDLHDAWRVLNRTGRDYSFFSKPHQVFSRIDFFLTSGILLDRIKLYYRNPGHL